MNLIGKIFVILILVMSLTFMTMAMMVYATHQNWRTVALDLKDKLQTANKELQEKQAQFDQFKDEVAKNDREKREALAKLETERTELAKQVEDLKKQRDTLATKDRENVAALDAAQQNLAKLTTEVEGLRKDIRDTQADRDKQFEQVVKLTDQIHQAQGDVARLEERRMQLAGQVAAQERVLTAYGLNKDTPVDHLPPLMRGKVLAVNKDNMVELSLGSDDGLRVGHTLEVFRASNYLGRVEVLSTLPDRSVGKILPGFKRGAIQEGDDVATRFKVS